MGSIYGLVGVGFTFPRQASVEVTYTGGYLDDDAAGFSAAQLEEWSYTRAGAHISLAVARQVAHEFRRREKGLDGMESVSEAQTTFTLSKEPWLPEVRAVIDQMMVRLWPC